MIKKHNFPYYDSSDLRVPRKEVSALIFINNLNIESTYPSLIQETGTNQVCMRDKLFRVRSEISFIIHIKIIIMNTIHCK